MTKRVRRSNVKDGVLLPLGNGFSLVKGDHPNKVDDVDIGPNNKNGLSVNHGEILQQQGNILRVFSAEPMLGGVSPVQLLYGGMAPDKVFAMQEQYKQANRIADDGTKYQKGGKKQTPVKEIDWSDIITTNKRPYNKDYINYINKSLINSGYNNNQRASILANIIEESGGNPFAEGPGGYYGLLQWGSERYSKSKETDVYKEIDNQLKYLNDTIGNTKDKKSWTHGGKGSGYNSFNDAMNAYNSDNLNKVMHGFTWGYVRPAGKQNSYLNRQKVADQLIKKEGFQLGGQINKQSLGERPNAKFGKEMKNKRIKAIRGYDGDKDNILNPSIITAIGRPLSSVNLPLQVTAPTIGPRNPFNAPKAISSNSNFVNPVVDKYGVTTGVNGNVTSIKTPESQGLKVPEVTPKTSKSSGLSALGADLIGAGINAAGSLIAAGINQNAINNQKFTPRKAVLLNPVKLKTKININSQLGQMRETVAKISDAARRTSASSRNVYQRIADTRLRGLDAMMGLYGDKENKETSLINQDRLNQQSIANQNATNVINTHNTNIAGKDALNNNWHMLTAQNWINPVNVIAGTVAGPQGLLARRDARRNNAVNLAMMSLAYPDAARMIMSGDGWQKAFNGYYDMLNNKVRV